MEREAGNSPCLSLPGPVSSAPPFCRRKPRTSAPLALRLYAVHFTLISQRNLASAHPIRPGIPSSSWSCCGTSSGHHHTSRGLVSCDTTGPSQAWHPLPTQSPTGIRSSHSSHSAPQNRTRILSLCLITCLFCFPLLWNINVSGEPCPTATNHLSCG